MISIRSSIHNLVLGVVLASSFNVYAQLPSRASEDSADLAPTPASTNIGTSTTGISQANPLARPLDSLSTLNREVGKVGGDTNLNSADDLNRALARTRAPAKPEAPTQFQRYVQETTGKLLPHFGAQLFEAPQAYVPDSGLAAPANYVLGPGDEVRVQVWGAIDFSATLPVDRNGQVLIPKVGAVPLVGVTAGNLEQVLKGHLSKVFTNFSLSASLSKIRSIQIYVVGQARQPGSYAVSSLSTLVNALFISGGPSANGSMRAIELQRAGKTVTTIDLYDFIAKGNKSADVSLLAGDVIFIPPASKRVAIAGAVDQPAIYEIKDPSTTVQDILAVGGGLNAMSSTRRALLERVSPESVPARQVKDIALNDAGLRTVLQAGDVLTLLPLDRAFSNAVTLRGAVAEPYRYPFKAGMRVSDLIPEPSALIQKDYFARKNALVQYEINPLVATDGRGIADVRTTNKANPYESRGLGDATKQLGADARNPTQNTNGGGAEVRGLLEEINWDYASIERLDAKELRTVLIPINLGKAVKAKDPAHDLVLQAGDVVTVFSVNDIAVPMEKRTQLVKIGGEVMVPGIYQIQPGETLPQLVRRAGGFSHNAFPYGLVFTRESTRQQQQANLDRSLRRAEADLNSQTAALLQNSTDATTAAATQAQLASQKAALGRLQMLKASGRISLELDPDKPVLPSIELQDGDQITVPIKPSFVSVFGEVLAENAALHRPGNTVADYLDRAGLTKDADVDNVMIVRADGGVEGDSRKSNWFSAGVLSKRLNPGDSIFVPSSVDKRTAYNRFVEGAKDWTAIFYQFGLGAAGLKTLRN